MGLALLLAWPSLGLCLNCDGKVNNVSIDASGTVFVGTTASPTHGVCNIVSKGSFGMQIESCKAAYALLMSAKVSGTSVRLYYSDVSNCAQISGWSPQPSFYHAEMF